MSKVTIHVGDALDRLRAMKPKSVHMIATSPPYWGLRDYGHEEQLGLEETPKEYVSKLVKVFRAARRVLRDDGTLWLNLGDCYAQGGRGGIGDLSGLQGSRQNQNESRRAIEAVGGRLGGPRLKPKDLVGIPWAVAFALRDSGWWLRGDNIWAKGSCMPESCTDRPTKSHEYVFLLAKSERYFFDMEAVREAAVSTDTRPRDRGEFSRGAPPGTPEHHGLTHNAYTTRHMRSVWTIQPLPFPGAHFATFPPELPERCIKAGTSERGACSECGAPLERVVERGDPDLERQRACGGDVEGEYHGQSTKGHDAVGVQNASAVKARILAGMRERRTVGWSYTCEHEGAAVVPCVVLDPFGGAGTTALVAARLQRDAILVDLNPEYARMAADRITQDAPMFNRVEVLGP